jgi:hypothetical protein
MGYWAKLASRAAFRKGYGVYCGFRNPVEPGMWAGGIVGLKSILGVKRRQKALWIMHELEDLGYQIIFSDPFLLADVIIVDVNKAITLNHSNSECCIWFSLRY